MESNTEQIWCQASIQGRTFLLGCFYRPPDANIGPLLELDANLASLNASSRSPIIVLGGDFNVPGLDWSHSTQSVPKGALQESLFDLIINNHLTQKVSFPTRRDCTSGAENTLDLLLTSHPDLISEVSPRAGISDHFIVLAKLITKIQLPLKPPRKISLWKKVNSENFKNLVKELGQDFFKMKPATRSVEENWTWFRDSLNNIVTNSVPQKLIKGRTRPPWFSAKLKRLCSKKEKSYIRAKKSGTKSDWDKFTSVRKQVDRAIRNAHRQHVSSILEDGQPKEFWRYIKSRRTDNTGIQTLKVNDVLVTDDQEKAETLAAHFQNVFTREDEDPSSLPKLPTSPFPEMSPITIDVEGVRKLLLNINTAKAIGPDQIQNQALKIAADELAPVLQFIFQQSLDSGELPLDWRSASIAPLFKKGSATDPANYRPISLTCTCCKLLEHIIDSQLMNHLSEHNILSDNQHAFRKRRSCESQLVLTVNDLAKNLDTNTSTDVLALDFSKAFDVIPHKRLIQKLNFYGVRSNTLRWISNFLTKRFQRVCVNGQSSEWYPVLSGTPQGTVLGPHLFLLFINDIQEEVTSTTRLFADDCLLYRPINSPDDEIVLQKDLDTMVKWSHRWGMQFNPTKCESMRVSRKRSPGKTSYNIHGVSLEEAKEIKYLGVKIQNDLRWNCHTHHSTSKAAGVLNFLRRNFHHCSSTVKEKLYFTLVRPHLEYAVAAWDPYTVKNISSIERIQRQAARFVTNTYDRESSVTQLLNSLGWNTLQARREAHRLTCFHKMLSNKLDIDYLSHTKPKLSRSRRGHSHQFDVPSSRLEVHRSSFFPRTIKAWNELPPAIITQSNPAKFKEMLLNKIPV